MNNDRDQKQGKYLPLLIGTCAFSFSMILLWFTQRHTLDHLMIYVGAGYALICFSFLLFQLYAFARAHLVYDEDVEDIKFKVFELEDPLACEPAHDKNK